MNISCEVRIPKRLINRQLYLFIVKALGLFTDSRGGDEGSSFEVLPHPTVTSRCYAELFVVGVGLFLAIFHTDRKCLICGNKDGR